MRSFNLVLATMMLGAAVASGAAGDPPAGPESPSVTPTVRFSTYLGGSIADQAWAIAADAQGNSYITGYTASDDFPTFNAFQPVSQGQGDAFVAKFGPDGALVYATYLGGDYLDVANAIAVDATGAVYVTGWTGSSDFPVVNAYQATYHGGWDAFVTKLAPDGQSLVFSTYLGGSSEESAEAIALGADGSVYLTGDTQSTDFPLVAPFQSQLGGSVDAFVAKLAPGGNALLYSTYLGGAGGGETGHGIAVDAAGQAHVTGWTTAGDFPIANAWQGFLSGVWDVFVTKLGSGGDTLVYSTYLGGYDEEYVDQGRAIAVDSAGTAYVAGFTGSYGFPTFDAYQPFYGGQIDLFVTKYAGDGQMLYSTYLGGFNSEVATGIALDGARNFHVAGLTLSENYPVVDPIQSVLAGYEDPILVKFRADGQSLEYSTYYGGGVSGREEYGATGIALDAAGGVHVVGQTEALDFPVVDPHQPTNAGSYDAFVLALEAPALFADGFESGDLSRWSFSLP